MTRRPHLSNSNEVNMRDLLMTEPTLYTTLMPVHRECSARKVVHCLQGAVVVVAGTREPQTEAAEKGRQHTRKGAAGTGRCVQPVRHTLCSPRRIQRLSWAGGQWCCHNSGVPGCAATGSTTASTGTSSRKTPTCGRQSLLGHRRV